MFDEFEFTVVENPTVSGGYLTLSSGVGVEEFYLGGRERPGVGPHRAEGSGPDASRDAISQSTLDDAWGGELRDAGVRRQGSEAGLCGYDCSRG